MRKLFWLLSFVLNALVLPNYTLASATSTNGDEEKAVDEDWYQIELVVLRHLNNEQYLVDLPFEGAPDFNAEEHYSLVQGSAITSTQISQIDSDSLAIKEKYDTLARSRNYRPVLLTGWKMFLPPEKEELPVRITAGDTFDNAPEIEGYITVKRNRYLHVYADLALSEFAEIEKNDSDNLLDAILNQQQPMTSLLFQQTTADPYEPNSTQTANALDQSLTQEAPKYFIKSHQRLKESRRLRSEELHYLDHPVMGILLRIIPTTAPVSPESIKDEFASDTPEGGVELIPSDNTGEARPHR